jgi:hypothetical protein
MTVAIVANVDCEATWAARPLPTKVRSRLALLSTLFRTLVTDDDCLIFGTAELDRKRVVEHRELATMQWKTFDDPSWLQLAKAHRSRSFAWAGTSIIKGSNYDPGNVPWQSALSQGVVDDATAKLANDRRMTMEVRRLTGAQIPGECIVTSIADLEAHINAGGASFSDGAWVAKAPWTAAGRDRVWGQGNDSDALHRAAKLVRSCGALIFEPWLQRIEDFGILAIVTATTIEQRAPHRLLCNQHGGFAGIDCKIEVATPPERQRMVDIVHVVGSRLRTAGYLGPFTVDGFYYLHHGQRQLHALCEINARLSFGWIALATTTMFRASAFRVGDAAPTHATPLVLPTSDDPLAVWVE